MTNLSGSILYAEDAERSILGGMLIDPSALVEANTLDARAFYLSSHRTIFNTMRAMTAAGAHVDLVTLSEELRRRNLIDTVGGPAYIASLTTDLPRRLDISSYVRVVRDKADSRSIIATCNEARVRAEKGDEPLEILDFLQRAVSNFQMHNTDLEAKPISGCVVPAWEQIRDEMTTEVGRVIGIPTGIEPLDKMTTGWRDGELTYVGAQPGMGKSAFMLQCMYAAASKGFGVGCISLEMRSAQLIKRLAIIASDIPAMAWRDPRNIPVAMRKHAQKSLLSLGDLPIWIVDQSGLNPRQISALAMKMHAAGAKIIFVDFVQIIEETGNDRREAINRVSAALRDTCKLLNIPFVVLSQLSRGDKERNRRPRKEDLRESGNLEQDAHNVLLLYRPKDENGDYPGIDEIIVDKAREGVIGTTFVTFDQRSLTYKVKAKEWI